MILRTASEGAADRRGPAVPQFTPVASRQERCHSTGRKLGWRREDRGRRASFFSPGGSALPPSQARAFSDLWL